MEAPGEVRRLVEADAPAAFELFAEVQRTAPAGFLTNRLPAEFQALTGTQSCSAGYFEGGRLYAYALGRIVPADGTAAHRQGLLRTLDEPLGVLQGTIAHPERRGLGLHGRLYRARRDLFVARGVTQHMGIVFTTNLASLEANLKCALLLRGLIEDADGMNFLVYVDTLEFARPDDGAAEWIGAGDLPRIEAAVRRGLRGWSLRRDGGPDQICFAPALPGS